MEILNQKESIFGPVRKGLGSSANPLDPSTRRDMEASFGFDFGQVRVHYDSRANESARALNAKAYTLGSDIVFREGHFAPNVVGGRRLLAHELTHVVQQSRASTVSTQFLKAISRPGDASEREAEISSDRVMSGLPASVSAIPGAVVQGDLGTVLGIGAGVVGAGLAAGAVAGALGRAKSKKWALTQTNTDGSAGSNYASDVAIKYNPDAGQDNCDEIAFVQNVRVIDATGASQDPRSNFKNRITSSGWTIDRLEQKKYGWYGYNNDGRPSGTVTPGKSPKPVVAAEMTDKPQWNVPNLTFDFETCAVCKNGTDRSKVYGCLTWGFDVDSANKLKSHSQNETAAPSAEFSEAIKQWNAQAAGPAGKRNDPNQQPLGSFK
jgi:hypothetical protein